MKEFRASGRTELGGNHTDHQHGRVLCAAVDLYITALAEPSEGSLVTVKSEGFPDICVDISDLSVHPEEKNSSAALVRGVAKGISRKRYNLKGFNAELKSDIPAGSGLSSSAAFEVLIGRIFNDFSCGGRLSDTEIAQIGQYAENVYFGKPCGLMDQMASSLGGAVYIDFRDPEFPIAKSIDADLEKNGYSLFIIDTGSCHADLTEDYAAIPADMKAVAERFEKEVLGDVTPEEFDRALPWLELTCTDTELSRATHFFEENDRVPRMAKALETGDFNAYLKLVRASGWSSEHSLKNLIPPSHPQLTAIPDAIRAAEKLLDGEGAVRVHGGGFAGTIQAYAPLDKKEDFQKGMEALLGTGCCHQVRIVGK